MFLVQMLDRGDEGLFERTIIRPPGKEFEDAGVVNFRCAIWPFGNRQFFPLHAGVEHFEDVVEGAVITDLALRSAFGQREIWQDKFVELCWA